LLAGIFEIAKTAFRCKRDHKDRKMFRIQSVQPNRFKVGGADRPRPVRLALRVSDIRRAARSLHQRAEMLENRRDPDPQLRAHQRAEAASCRRLALMLEGGADDDAPARPQAPPPTPVRSHARKQISK
jgi:hypothetical protein